MTLQNGSDIWRNYEIPGVPSSGPHQPSKPDIVAWATMIEVINSGAGLAYVNLTGLAGDLAHAPNSTALVYNDATTANNGLYQKIGGSGVGSWSRIGDLPSGIVRFTVTGGTANAIVASATEVPLLPGNKLFLLTPTATNTGAVTLNGIAIKNAVNSALPANTLISGVPVAMIWQVDHYQLLLSVSVDTASVVADSVAARDLANGYAAAAAGSASALANQVANYDSYTLAQAATVPVGVKGLRVFGWAAFGDGPTAEYFRVATQPSTSAGKLRTTDRFLPNGSTDATNGGWWQLVISGPQDVRKFGIFAGTDATTLLQSALNTCSIFFPPAAANYILSGDILFVSNRRFQIQRGATIINTGGRFTGHLPGGGNIDLEINGVVGFLATNTAAQMAPDWPTSVTFGDERGLIEFGGSSGSPSSNIRVYGGGRVYSDYVWSGVPAGLTNNYFQINRKGIAIWNSSHVLVEGMEVDHVHGEAIYFNGYGNNFDIKFLNNFVHDVAFNGLNFNVSLAFEGLLMQGNTVINALQGIEISGGVADNNFFYNCNKGMITGGGGGITLRITNNRAINSSTIGYQLEFSALIQNVHISNNESISSGGEAFTFDFINTFHIRGNTSYGHAATTAAKSFLIKAGCSSGYVDGNLTTAAGSHSTGAVSNLAGSAVALGTNPAF